MRAGRVASRAKPGGGGEDREKWTDGYFTRCQLVYSATPTHQLSGRSPLQMASSLLRNVHFEFPPRPTFQREIYDSPSCFPVRDVASNFSFPLSSFEPFDLKQTCSNSDSLPLI